MAFPEKQAALRQSVEGITDLLAIPEEVRQDAKQILFLFKT